MKTAENDIIIRDLKQSKIGMKRRDDKTATNLCLHGRYVGVCLCTKVHKIKTLARGGTTISFLLPAWKLCGIYLADQIGQDYNSAPGHFIDGHIFDGHIFDGHIFDQYIK